VPEVPFGDEDDELDPEEVAEPGGEVVPFPAAASAGVAVRPDKHAPGEWKDVIPEHLRTREGRRKAAGFQVNRAKHHSAFHGVRSPLYLVQMILWGLFGLAKVVFVQVRWAWVAEQTYLRHKAVEDGDAAKWAMLHNHARKVRLFRFGVLVAELVPAVLVVVWVDSVMPLLWVPVGVPLAAFLAWLGRPDDKRIVTPAVVPVVVAKLTIPLIVRALGVLGIAEMNKALREEPETAIVTIDGPTRDGGGWLWKGELPPGVTAGEVSEKREKLASGLRRPLGCVWPETDHKRHPGAIGLYVSDEDMRSVDQPAWPLARRGKADVFEPQLIGYDPRGRPATVTLMFKSGIIGALPRMGKTFLLRLLLLICVLDPRVEVHAYDLKGTGDLAPLRPVAHRYRAGDEEEDLEYLLADLQELYADLPVRARTIREIAESDPARCPENKITPELSSDRSLGLHPVVLAVDEAQRAFDNKKFGPEIQELTEDLARRGPALGIIILLATQRVDAKSIPPSISSNAMLRWCLKVLGQVENDMVLGTSAYKSGIRATMFDDDDLGIAYYSGEGMRGRIMRSQYIDGPGARQVVARGYAMRKADGRITGYAAQQDQQPAARSFADDVLEVFGTDDKLWSETIAERLARSIGHPYADITKEAVGSQLRRAGVRVKTVREAGKSGKAGCERAAVAAVARNGVPQHV
jgi:S-DNA-T family DNA segregation ATPase FtsK/SpoIIIE